MLNIPRLTVTLEAVTPLFLNGADNVTPELRGASFRGVLRYWLRALLGAYIGDDTEKLYELESQVFGSTEAGSPVVIRTRARSLIRGKRRVLPHSTDRNKSFPANAWTEGSAFDLIISTQPGQRAIPNTAFAALLLLLNFGGLGKRSRRGFGSLRAIGVAQEHLALPTDLIGLFTPRLADGTALEAHLRAVLAATRRLTVSGASIGGSVPAPPTLPHYPILAGNQALVLVCRHPFAARSHPYAEVMVDFWRRVLRVQPFLNASEFGTASPRRASSLILHIARSEAGLHLVLTAMRSQPNGDRGGDTWWIVEELLRECACRYDGVLIHGMGGW